MAKKKKLKRKIEALKFKLRVERCYSELLTNMAHGDGLKEPEQQEEKEI